MTRFGVPFFTLSDDGLATQEVGNTPAWPLRLKRTTNVKVESECPLGRVYIYGAQDETIRANCFKNDSSTWDSQHSESQHSMNQYMWYASRYYPCVTPDPSKAKNFMAILDWKSGGLCINKLYAEVLNSTNWNESGNFNEVLLWAQSNGRWGLGRTIQLADDQLEPLQHTSRLSGDGTPCIHSMCYTVYSSWGRYGMTEPYFFYSPRKVTKRRTLSVVGAWSNSRGSASVRRLRLQLSTKLGVMERAVWYDTSITTHNRNWSIVSVEDGVYRSWLCVIPPGDSPSRRALSTCIIGGAIPIICSDKYVPTYPHLKWDTFSFRIPEATCATQLDRLTHLSRKTLEPMQERLFQVRGLFNIDPNGSNIVEVFEAYLRSFSYIRSLPL